MSVTIKMYISVMVGRSKVDSMTFVVMYICLVKFVNLVFFMVNVSYMLSI